MGDVKGRGCVGPHVEGHSPFCKEGECPSADVGGETLLGKEAHCPLEVDVVVEP